MIKETFELVCRVLNAIPTQNTADLLRERLRKWHPEKTF